MITVPTLAYDASNRFTLREHVTIGQCWTVWTYQWVRYGWQGDELMATDAEGRRWKFRADVGIWVHVQEKAA